MNNVRSGQDPEFARIGFLEWSGGKAVREAVRVLNSLRIVTEIWEWSKVFVLIPGKSLKA